MRSGADDHWTEVRGAVENCAESHAADSPARAMVSGQDLRAPRLGSLCVAATFIAGDTACLRTGEGWLSLAAAIIDRNAHHGRLIVFDGESLPAQARAHAQVTVVVKSGNSPP